MLARAGRDGRIVSVRNIYGGLSSDIKLITHTSASGTNTRLVLKRQIHPDDWWATAVANEAIALRVARKCGIPVPEVLGFKAKKAGVILMTLVPGKVHLKPQFDGWVSKLVDMLVAIHAIPVEQAGRVFRQQMHLKPNRRRLPDWSKNKKMWNRVFRLASQEFELPLPGFCHGDYHPGNILWSRNSISGVIDWQFAGIYPQQMDVAHCRSNLALLEGRSAATTFLNLYRERTGRSLPNQRVFDARDLFNFGPEPSQMWDWQGFGRPDLTRSKLRRNFEAYASSLLAD